MNLNKRYYNADHKGGETMQTQAHCHRCLKVFPIGMLHEFETGIEIIELCPICLKERQELREATVKKGA